MESLDARPPTPPHHPTAGVRVLRDEIDNIASCGFPDSELVSVAQLPSGKSYNNRIYFLTFRHPSDKASSDAVAQPEQEVVLKVNGRFFGEHKVQNEVACLQLLQAHCPDVPTPRALAWSEDGHVATFATPFRTASISLDESLCLNSHTLGHGGWVLMTRVEGDPIASADLDEAAWKWLAGQLGDIVTSWRRNIPAQPHCGNIRLPHEGVEAGRVPTVRSSALEVRGILQEGIDVAGPIAYSSDYYRIKLADKLRELETSNTYAANRSLAAPIRAFIAEKLPHLQLTGPSGNEGIGPGQFVFTHYDLSPRNVLVSGQPPRISGLVDFEFAGFFPPVEEFLNDYICNAGDWPQAFYNAYLARLEHNGIATPLKSLDADTWNLNCWLETLLGCIVPWELPGGHRGAALEAKLREAEASAREMLEKLSSPGEFREPIAPYGDE
ncbi:hypothetical protein TOPH_07054 [Tolypocladium ophioglossoides CBS 100239]|uniref:Aminoglycoside phosphotransferase domain-containing protein n=1 Tax=Tolypocladium ophioglossoides (strain CBS 100239) TaxID=1163406 RepID=A0A0L0N2J1_TOLOC|nr:hypothetical protein TOPH_07054 [Tolypocladium ophioglossoides CBS 100239]